MVVQDHDKDINLKVVELVLRARRAYIKGKGIDFILGTPGAVQDVRKTFSNQYVKNILKTFFVDGHVDASEILKLDTGPRFSPKDHIIKMIGDDLRSLNPKMAAVHLRERAFSNAYMISEENPIEALLDTITKYKISGRISTEMADSYAAVVNDAFPEATNGFNPFTHIIKGAIDIVARNMITSSMAGGATADSIAEATKEVSFAIDEIYEVAGNLTARLIMTGVSAQVAEDGPLSHLKDMISEATELIYCYDHKIRLSNMEVKEAETISPIVMHIMSIADHKSYDQKLSREALKKYFLINKHFFCLKQIWSDELMSIINESLRTSIESGAYTPNTTSKEELLNRCKFLMSDESNPINPFNFYAIGSDGKTKRQLITESVKSFIVGYKTSDNREAHIIKLHDDITTMVRLFPEVRKIFFHTFSDLFEHAHQTDYNTKIAAVSELKKFGEIAKEALMEALVSRKTDLALYRRECEVFEISRHDMIEALVRWGEPDCSPGRIISLIMDVLADDKTKLATSRVNLTRIIKTTDSLYRTSFNVCKEMIDRDLSPENRATVLMYLGCEFNNDAIERAYVSAAIGAHPYFNSHNRAMQLIHDCKLAGISNNAIRSTIETMATIDPAVDQSLIAEIKELVDYEKQTKNLIEFFKLHCVRRDGGSFTIDMDSLTNYINEKAGGVSIYAFMDGVINTVGINAAAGVFNSFYGDNSIVNRNRKETVTRVLFSRWDKVDAKVVANQLEIFGVESDIIIDTMYARHNEVVSNPTKAEAVVNEIVIRETLKCIDHVIASTESDVERMAMIRDYSNNNKIGKRVRDLSMVGLLERAFSGPEHDDDINYLRLVGELMSGVFNNRHGVVITTVGIIERHSRKNGDSVQDFVRRCFDAGLEHRSIAFSGHGEPHYDRKEVKLQVVKTLLERALDIANRTEDKEVLELIKELVHYKDVVEDNIEDIYNVLVEGTSNRSTGELYNNILRMYLPTITKTLDISNNNLHLARAFLAHAKSFDHAKGHKIDTTLAMLYIYATACIEHGIDIYTMLLAFDKSDTSLYTEKDIKDNATSFTESHNRVAEIYALLVLRKAITALPESKNLHEIITRYKIDGYNYKEIPVYCIQNLYTLLISTMLKTNEDNSAMSSYFKQLDDLFSVNENQGDIYKIKAIITNSFNYKKSSDVADFIKSYGFSTESAVQALKSIREEKQPFAFSIDDIIKEMQSKASFDVKAMVSEMTHIKSHPDFSKKFESIINNNKSIFESPIFYTQLMETDRELTRSVINEAHKYLHQFPNFYHHIVLSVLHTSPDQITQVVSRESAKNIVDECLFYGVPAETIRACLTMEEEREYLSAITLLRAMLGCVDGGYNTNRDRFSLFLKQQSNHPKYESLIKCIIESSPYSNYTRALKPLIDMCYPSFVDNTETIKSILADYFLKVGEFTRFVAACRDFHMTDDDIKKFTDPEMSARYNTNISMVMETEKLIEHVRRNLSGDGTLPSGTILKFIKDDQLKRSLLVTKTDFYKILVSLEPKLIGAIADCIRKDYPGYTQKTNELMVHAVARMFGEPVRKHQTEFSVDSFIKNCKSFGLSNSDILTVLKKDGNLHKDWETALWRHINKETMDIVDILCDPTNTKEEARRKFKEWLDTKAGNELCSSTNYYDLIASIEALVGQNNIGLIIDIMEKTGVWKGTGLKQKYAGKVLGHMIRDIGNNKSAAEEFSVYCKNLGLTPYDAWVMSRTINAPKEVTDALSVVSMVEHIISNSDLKNAPTGSDLKNVPTGGNTSTEILPKKEKSAMSKIIDQFKSDAQEIALRASVSRGRKLLATKIAEFMAKRSIVRRPNESDDDFLSRASTEQGTLTNFFLSDAGMGFLSYIVGSFWPAIKDQVPEGDARDLGDSIAREIRIQGGVSVVDGIMDEVLSPMLSFLTTEAKTLGADILGGNPKVTAEDVMSHVKREEELAAENARLKARLEEVQSGSAAATRSRTV